MPFYVLMYFEGLGEVPLQVFFHQFSKWPPKCRKIDLARISAKIDIQGKHDVTSSSMTSKITTELHFRQTKVQNYITRYCPSICLQLGSDFFFLLGSSLVEKKVYAFTKIYVRISVKPLNYFNWHWNLKHGSEYKKID